MRRIGRRTFLHDLGRKSFGVVLLGGAVAACSDDDATTTEPVDTTATSSPTTTGDSPEEATATTTDTADAAEDQLRFRRVSLDFVSAYILVRGSEAAIVDTGSRGDAPRIEAALGELGLGWDAVGDLVLTHSHGDHVGSLTDIVAATPGVTAHAGGADIPSIDSPIELLAVGDGDRVFGLDIVDTPGHTPGHISVLDPAGSLLVAGDAINGADGGVVGPTPRFTADLDAANASAVKLGTFRYETVVFGHGDPVEGGASDTVAEMAATL
ncbi:MAG: MBL fold metallo-hydrolase [Actinomycetota bacterium]